MKAFIAIIFASLLSRLGYQMARSPVLPTFAAELGALPELIGIIVAASTITGVFFKLPAGALSDVLGRKRMMVLGALFFALHPLRVESVAWITERRDVTSGLFFVLTLLAYLRMQRAAGGDRKSVV